MIKNLLGVMLSGDDDFLENNSEVRKNGSMTFFASIFSLCEKPNLCHISSSYSSLMLLSSDDYIDISRS